MGPPSESSGSEGSGSRSPTEGHTSPTEGHMSPTERPPSSAHGSSTRSRQGSAGSSTKALLMVRFSTNDAMPPCGQCGYTVLLARLESAELLDGCVPGVCVCSSLPRSRPLQGLM